MQTKDFHLNKRKKKEKIHCLEKFYSQFVTISEEMLSSNPRAQMPFETSNGGELGTERCTERIRAIRDNGISYRLFSFLTRPFFSLVFCQGQRAPRSIIKLMRQRRFRSVCLLRSARLLEPLIEPWRVTSFLCDSDVVVCVLFKLPGDPVARGSIVIQVTISIRATRIYRPNGDSFALPFPGN